MCSDFLMIFSHFGRKDILPSDIATEPGNFFIKTAMLHSANSVKGITISTTRIARTDLDWALRSGSVVVVGISYQGGPLPDHFVVQSGSYVTNDPQVMAISFTSHL